jgi:hypothetical protein
MTIEEYIRIYRVEYDDDGEHYTEYLTPVAYMITKGFHVPAVINVTPVLGLVKARIPGLTEKAYSDSAKIRAYAARFMAELATRCLSFARISACKELSVGYCGRRRAFISLVRVKPYDVNTD